MKKILLITLLLIPFIGFSQTTKPIDGFLGIKFGSSKADVLAAVKAKGGVLNKDANDQLLFTGVKLGHLNTYYLQVDFYNNQAYLSTFVFKDDVEDQTIDFYNDLVSQVNDIYGKGVSQRTFKSTFKDGDGFEITAIKEGDADFGTYWTDKTTQNYIKAAINTQLYVYLIYSDKALYDLAKAKQKAKEKADF
jgi:hypothetical protein